MGNSSFKFQVSFFIFLFLLSSVLCLPSSGIAAGKVALKIRAGNPIPKTQIVKIKSVLPIGITTNDIVNAAGLDIMYDVKTDTCYLYKEVELGPQAIKVYDVELKDVWVIDIDATDKILKHSEEMQKQLAGTEYESNAVSIVKLAQSAVDSIKKNQAANEVKPGLKVYDHIRAYELNAEKLVQIKKDVGYLENLVLGIGKDPGELLGIVRSTPTTQRQSEGSTNDYKLATLKITVHNSSSNLVKKIQPLKWDLPKEIKAGDVVNSDGLEILTDKEKDQTYLYKDVLELQPMQIQVYNVRIFDKWNVNTQRFASVRVAVSSIQERVKGVENLKSVSDSIKSIIEDLDKLEKVKGPDVFSASYVNFYRRQSDQLNLIEDRLNRILSVLKPIDKNSKLGFKAKPPSSKSTWMIIYIIIGFLAVVSLAFFFRWYGKSGLESIEDKRET